jgi:hypothetical protein
MPTNSTYSCGKGATNLDALKDLLSAKDKQYQPTDLYIGAYQNNY